MKPIEPDDLCIDACPDCDRRNATLPAELLSESVSSVTFAYVCSVGHEWTCSWAEPRGEREAG